MDAQQLQTVIDQINATLYMSEQDRQVELTRIQQQYNLGMAELEQAGAIAEMENEARNRDRTANFWANLLGGLVGGGGTALGGFLSRPVETT